MYEWNIRETDTIEQADWADWEVTDNVVLDSFRYIFAVTKDRTKMRIYKQIGVNSDSC